MKKEFKKLIFIETEEELKCFSKYYKNKDFSIQKILLVTSSPNIRVFLNEAGFSVKDSIDFYSLEDQIKGGDYVNSVVSAFQGKKIDIEDEYGVNESYRISIQYRIQYFVAHLAYLSILYKNILNLYGGIDSILCFQQKRDGETSPLLKEDESYHERIIDIICESKGIGKEVLGEYETFSYRKPSFNFLKKLAFHLIRKMAQFSLFFQKKESLVITSTVNKMDVIISNTQKENKEVRTILLHGLSIIDEIPNLTWIQITKKMIINFVSLLYTALNKKIKIKRSLSVDSIIDFQSLFLSTYLRKKVFDEKEYFLKDESLFIFNGYNFYGLINEKFQKGILPLINRSILGTQVLVEILDQLNIISLLTPLSLDATSTIGELCKIKGIRGILISHGSHSSPRGGGEIQEYKRHGEVLIDSQYPYVAIQSEFANDYCNYFDIKSKRLETGPLCWGILDQSDPEILEKIGLPKGKKVIVHAGTQKGRSSHYFYRYETSDEYIKGLIELIQAVEGMKDTVLLIKFRDGETLSYDNLQKLLPKKSNVYFNKDASFLQIIEAADLLVSYSSTTIEEAFEFNTPVLLYGCAGKISFTPAYELKNQEDFIRSPSYLIKSDKELSFFIPKILEEFRKNPLQAEELGDYIIRKKERLSLSKALLNI